MLAFLPSSEATVFFANTSALHRAGVLNMFAVSKTSIEPDYQDFVRRTQFDYTRDIRAIAGAVDTNRILLLIRGRFDWNRLRAYALTHGGICKDPLCNLPAANPGRWISFLPIQPDVMALAVASDGAAVTAVSTNQNRTLERVPPYPVWVRVAPAVFRKPVALPFAVRIFAISLQPADRVLLSLDLSGTSAWPFVLRLDAQCPNFAAAETMKAQLELETRLLRMELARERRQPRPDDLTGLLVAGSFAVSKKRVIGDWPIRKELLKTLE